MKRAFLCAVLMLMCVSSAFGGEKEDLALVQAVMDSNSTPAQIKALIQSGANANFQEPQTGGTVLI